MSLKSYQKKRNFSQTPEPKGRKGKGNQQRFVVQKHAARQLHYDFRLELAGVLKSWAVPKGPCFDPKVKRLAVEVEDHPLDYGSFEGIIPKGQYGGGTVMLWDQGRWESLDSNPVQALKKGHLHFMLYGKKLKGQWDLIRFKDEEKNWFLVKHKDEFAQSLDDYDVTQREPNSVATHQSMEDISNHYTATWSKQGAVPTANPLQKLDLPQTKMPIKVAPQLAVLSNKAPEGENWLHEIKWDGYRIIAFKNGSKVKLLSRNNIDWTKQFQSIAAVVAKLPIDKLVLDGELVLLDEKQHSNFQLLQNALKDNNTAPFIYYLFDLIYYHQWDVRSLSLLSRKELLLSLIDPALQSLQFSDHVIGQGGEFFNACCDLGLEGTIAKQVDSPYSSSRSPSWLKIKCSNRQEFVVGGFSPPRGSRDYFGSLLLGVYDQQGLLHYAGKVGTGFNQKSLQLIHKELAKRLTKECPFASRPPESKQACWVSPELVVEVEFSEWTDDNRLRHPSYKGLRKDKKAAQVVKEIAQPIPATKAAVKLSHADKVLYPEDGITKQDLSNYYEQVADRILPFIANRALTLTRCPDNYRHCFYQKKLPASSADYLHTVSVESTKNHSVDPYIYLNDINGLLSLVQMAVLEIHPWGSQVDKLEYPDVLVFDLDPDADLPWLRVVDAALEVKHYLAEYQLMSFVKTTGGKGLHVVVPIKPEYDWPQVKQFCQIFVEFLVGLKPKQYIGTMAKAKRKGKIFIDYLRNQRGATAIAAYSTRARLHVPIATPIHWDELTKDQRDTYFTIKTIGQRLKHLRDDPWQDFWMIQQSLRLNELNK